MKEDNGTFGIIVGGLFALAAANWAAKKPSWAMKICRRSRRPISK
jgi:hypothetical protein